MEVRKVKKVRKIKTVVPLPKVDKEITMTNYLCQNTQK